MNNEHVRKNRIHLIYNLETKLAVMQNEMLHSFELVKRYYKTKKKGFK